jgi:hypothetical protein
VTASLRVLAAQSPPIDELDSIDALRRWAKTVEGLHRATGGGGCPLGSLANELAHHSDAARILVQEGFLAWTDRLARGFERMQSRERLERRRFAERAGRCGGRGCRRGPATREDRPKPSSAQARLRHGPPLRGSALPGIGHPRSESSFAPRDAPVCTIFNRSSQQ